MLRPSFANIVLYIFVKYLIVYAVFMVATKNFKLLEIGKIKNGEDLFYYLWIILFIPIVNILLISVPLFLSFKVKNKIYFLSLIVIIFLVEYFVYVYFTSQKYFDVKGIIIEIISCVIFYLFFYRKINTLFSSNSASI